MNFIGLYLFYIKHVIIDSCFLSNLVNDNLLSLFKLNVAYFKEDSNTYHSI